MEEQKETQGMTDHETENSTPPIQEESQAKASADTPDVSENATGAEGTDSTESAQSTESADETTVAAAGDTDEAEDPVTGGDAAQDADVAEEPVDESDDDESPQDEFAQLMKDYDLKSTKAASRITGKIIDFIGNKVVVDIGQKTEGILNKEELLDWDGDLKYNVGDSITVICKNVNSKEGYITVSKKQVDAQEGWTSVKTAYEKKETVTGRIVGIVDDNKGFKVDMGVEMFLPMSQADIKKVKSPKSWLGKELEFKITRINSREKNGVVSHRVLMEEEKEVKIKELFESLEAGQVLTGRVTSLTDYGAFVDIGGMDGLVHKDNISYGRVNHPREKLKKGEEVQVKVLDMDAEKKRISLGMKQCYDDPWVTIAEKYPVGKKLIAKVTKIVNFGAFIELEDGVEGLLHISDLTWEGKTNSVEEFVAVGERLWVQVIELNPDEKKIKLGLKQLEMRPEEKYIQKHSAGEVVKGLVKKILKSRIFVELEKGVEGVVKISDITYFRIDSPHEYLKEKETIDVKIMSDTLDSNHKVKLSIKQIHDGEWREYINANRPGTVVMIKVKKVTEKGISVDISKNIEGFIRPNEIGDKNMEVSEMSELYPEGTETEALVVSSDFERKRIYLSFRALKRKRERDDIDRYAKSESETVTTIGDLFESAIDKKK